jgi:hypothetical protein
MAHHVPRKPELLAFFTKVVQPPLTSFFKHGEIYGAIQSLSTQGPFAAGQRGFSLAEIIWVQSILR